MLLSGFEHELLDGKELTHLGWRFYICIQYGNSFRLTFLFKS